MSTRPAEPHGAACASPIELGPVERSASSSSGDIRSSATFTVTGQSRAISGEGRAFRSTTIVGPR